MSDLDRRGLVVLMLSALLLEGDNLKARPLLDVYRRISDALEASLGGAGLTKVRAGTFGDFATTTAFGSLVGTLVMVDDSRTVRTIHKAKGDEFDNVVVFDEGTLKDIGGSGTQNRISEESNIRYVALSRARDRLFIGVPELSIAEETRLVNLRLPLEVHRLADGGSH